MPARTNLSRPARTREPASESSIPTVLRQELLAHLDDCPLGWHGDRILAGRWTTERDVLLWLQRLRELADRLRSHPNGDGV